MAFSTSQVTLENLDTQNFFETTLKQVVTDGTDTNIYLNALPTSTEGFLTIEPTSSSGREIIHYNSKGADYVTVPSASTGRGIGGTTAQGHAVSSVVRMADPAELFRVLKNRIQNINKGWIIINETVTCGTNNVLTISSSGYGIYVEVGDKIWVKDDGVDWMGYVVSKTSTSATVVGGDTSGNAVTLAAGSTITAPYYSKASSPVGFPANSDTFSPLGVNRSITTSLSQSVTATPTDIAGLTISPIVPTGKRIKITADFAVQDNTVSTGVVLVDLLKDGTKIRRYTVNCTLVGQSVNRNIIYVESPTAGSHTYKLQVSGATTSYIVGAAADNPASIMAEIV